MTRSTSKVTGHRADREKLFRALLPRLALCSPEGVSSLLLAGNEALYQVSVSVAYMILRVELPIPGYIIDTASPTLMQRKLGSIFRTRVASVDARYPYLGKYVRTLSFSHTAAQHVSSGENTESREDQRQDSWDMAVGLIGLSPNIEALEWKTGLGINSPLWKAISELSCLKKLSLTPPLPELLSPVRGGCPRISPKPQPHLPPGLDFNRVAIGYENGPSRRQAQVVGQGGWGLGMAWEGLEVLEIENLSQVGTRNLTAHLTLSEIFPSKLHTLSVGTSFLDLPLLTAIGRLGSQGVLRHLKLATSGTNLKVEGIKTIMSSCVGLESFVLDAVEGRLDKNTWKMVDDWPSSLRRMEIRMVESGDHHSWVLQHLSSIQYLPICQLTHLSVRRLVPSVAELPYPPINVIVPGIQAGHAQYPVPEDLSRLLIDQGTKLEHLCLDWWSLSTADLRDMLKNMPKLRTLRVALRAAFASITAMTTAFAGVPDLEVLELTCSSEYQSQAGLPKSCCSDEDLTALPPVLSAHLAEGDRSLPDVRELRKFVRRLSRLKEIAWAGRGGKGSWYFSKRTPTSSIVKVTFLHAAVSTLPLWYACQYDPLEFDFDDQPPVRLLEVPPPAVTVANKAEFPALSRTSTSSSASTTIATPVQLSPVVSRSDPAKRLSTESSRPHRFTTLPKSGGLSIRVAKPRTDTAHVRSKSVSDVRTCPFVAPSPKSPLLRTPEAHELLLIKAGGRNEKKGYTGILGNTARVVPGSGRSAAIVQGEKDGRSDSARGLDRVTIVEDDEDEYGLVGMGRSFGEDNKWTRVVKEKPKEIEVDAAVPKARKSRKSRALA